MSSTNSDSENEIDERLREAVDSNFINDGMFSACKKEATPIKNDEIPKSLRHLQNNDEQFNILGVTAEFQNYVAKQLSAIIDQQIELIQQSPSDLETPSSVGSIKLFANSTELVNDEPAEQNVTIQRRKKIAKRKLEEEDSYDKKASLETIAVAGSYILSGEETKHWSERTKRKPFTYKPRKNGTLELIE